MDVSLHLEAFINSLDGADPKKLARLACVCTRIALPFVRPVEDKPLRAIEALERWLIGQATLEEVRYAQAAAAYASGLYLASAHLDRSQNAGRAHAEASTILAAAAAGGTVLTERPGNALRALRTVALHVVNAVGAAVADPVAADAARIQCRAELYALMQKVTA